MISADNLKECVCVASVNKLCYSCTWLLESSGPTAKLSCLCSWCQIHSHWKLLLFVHLTSPFEANWTHGKTGLLVCLVLDLQQHILIGIPIKRQVQLHLAPLIFQDLIRMQWDLSLTKFISHFPQQTLKWFWSWDSTDILVACTYA